eukprot:TRINITY_DN22210_c0_g1_i1.p1 TRINITY_DN22210_c0_g1~~TRINITY_DN22210_c0_g1_i1.p1  ORF type:complete len:538 (+),score=91.43 TRINITY_DN22210_c0_g1_i1:20-1633(+)
MNLLDRTNTQTPNFNPSCMVCITTCGLIPYFQLIFSLSKGTSLFCDCLRSTLGQLHYLNLRNTGLQKKTMQSFVEALSNTTSLLKSLKELDISVNRLDSDTSRLLGVMLAKKDCVLETLHLSDSTPVFHRIIDGMTDGTLVKTCPTLKYLDLSVSRSRMQEELPVFITQHLPNLTGLNLSATEMTDTALASIVLGLKELNYLDLSDNELGLSCISALSEAKLLKTLKINRTVVPTRRVNDPLLTTIGDIAGTVGLTSLHIEGGARFTLKNEAAILVNALVKNPTLIELNISKQQGGDVLATAVGKMLQYNTALTSLSLENNEFSVKGLQTIKHGLLRNKTLQNFFLPVQDLSVLIATNPDLHEFLNLLNEIQAIVYSNAESQPTPSLTPRKYQQLNENVVMFNEQQLARANIRRYAQQHQPLLDTQRVSLIYGSGSFDVTKGEEELEEETPSVSELSASELQGIPPIHHRTVTSPRSKFTVTMPGRTSSENSSPSGGHHPKRLVTTELSIDSDSNVESKETKRRIDMLVVPEEENQG